MEPKGSTLTATSSTESQVNTEMEPLPHQEQPKHSFDYNLDHDSDISGLSTKTDKKDNLKEDSNLDFDSDLSGLSTKTDKEDSLKEDLSPQEKQKQNPEAPPSPLKPKQIIIQKLASVITPQPKATPGTTNYGKSNKKSGATSNVNKATPTLPDKNPTKKNKNIKEGKLADLITFKPAPIYTSPFLHNDFKLSEESLNLPPELESLQSLILSQHEAFLQSIKNLGLSNLNMTKILNNKKKSLQLIQKEKKIPRSLRIKCELTTSPSYTNNPVFIKLKTELQQKVSNFISDGSRIVTEWANMHVQLLITDRCSTILKTALEILDGLTSFYTDIMGTPPWPSTEDRYIPLFLLKLYFSNLYFDTKDLVMYLEVPTEDILLTGVKLFTNTQSNEDAKKILDSFDIDDVNMENQIEYTFVSEILINFNQILTLSTLGVWHHHEEIVRQTTAALKLKTKMKSKEIINASTATAEAITKATETINYNKILSANANLRISNLEKSIQKQEQKSNTIINQLKSKKHQKNLQGSHFTESVASPSKLTLTKKRTMVDLTLEDQESAEEQTTNMNLKMSSTPAFNKKQKQYKTKNLRTPTRKAVQWKEGEVKNFHPNYPVAKLFSTQMDHSPFTMNNHSHGQPLFPQTLPFFPQAPPPTSYTFQPQNPFNNYQTHLNVPNQAHAHHQQLNLNLNQNKQHTPVLNPFSYQHNSTMNTPFLNQKFHQRKN
jgi:hypothetical protein